MVTDCRRSKVLKRMRNKSLTCAGRRIELDNNDIDGSAINNAVQVHTRRRIEFFILLQGFLARQHCYS